MATTIDSADGVTLVPWHQGNQLDDAGSHIAKTSPARSKVLREGGGNSFSKVHFKKTAFPVYRDSYDHALHPKATRKAHDSIDSPVASSTRHGNRTLSERGLHKRGESRVPIRESQSIENCDSQRDLLPATTASLLCMRHNTHASGTPSARDIRCGAPTSNSISSRQSRITTISEVEELDGNGASLDEDRADATPLSLSSRYGYRIRKTADAESVIMGINITRKQASFWHPTKSSLMKMTTNTRACFSRGVEWSVESKSTIQSKAALFKSQRPTCKHKKNISRTEFLIPLSSHMRSTTRSNSSQKIVVHRHAKLQVADLKTTPTFAYEFIMHRAARLDQRISSKTSTNTSMLHSNEFSVDHYSELTCGGSSSSTPSNPGYMDLSICTRKCHSDTPRVPRYNRCAMQDGDALSDQQSLESLTQGKHPDECYNNQLSTIGTMVKVKHRKCVGIIGDEEDASTSASTAAPIVPHIRSTASRSSFTSMSMGAPIPIAASGPLVLDMMSLPSPAPEDFAPKTGRLRFLSLPAMTSTIPHARCASNLISASSSHVNIATRYLQSTSRNPVTFKYEIRNAGKAMRRHQMDLLIEGTARREKARMLSARDNDSPACGLNTNTGHASHLDYLAALIEDTARSMSKVAEQKPITLETHITTIQSMYKSPMPSPRSFHPSRSLLPKPIKARRVHLEVNTNAQDVKESILNPEIAPFVPARSVRIITDVVKGDSRVMSSALTPKHCVGSLSPPSPSDCAPSHISTTSNTPSRVASKRVALRPNTTIPRLRPSQLKSSIDVGPSTATAIPSIVHAVSTTPHPNSLAKSCNDICGNHPLQPSLIAQAGASESPQTRRTTDHLPIKHLAGDSAVMAPLTQSSHISLEAFSKTDTACEAIVRLIENSMSELETAKSDAELYRHHSDIYAQACKDVMSVGEALFTAREIAVKALEYQRKAENDMLHLFKNCEATRVRMQGLLERVESSKEIRAFGNNGKGRCTMDDDGKKRLVRIRGSGDEVEEKVDNANNCRTCESHRSYSTTSSVEFLLENSIRN